MRRRVRLAFVVSATLAGAAGTARAGTFWVREHADGVVEFTNKTPAGEGGGRWKVWLKTGPGKAAALRGRTDLVPPRDTSPSRVSRYDDHIRDQQAYYGIPEPLIRAIIKTESDYDPAVVSSVGAQGLMQLMPDTARMMGVTDAFDPRQNIMGGARYLQVLARRFCAQAVCTPEERIKVIAGYHAGPGAVEKYGGMPPYETTRAYVAAVVRRYDALVAGATETGATP
ncbi:MAG TPA: lytic transglycosylase domain-containing protein [Polyangia bacterium]|nr:lytic transglycosylase domain-containing protein [Polyangia bacterium]